ncbi:MAG TPA: MaoC family dehydratase [Pseudonocardiaceae bacterium]
MLHLENPSTLADHIGEQLGTSDWITIDQARINGFADVTEDHQWIHVDIERANAGPFGTTIAHGYLTLSLAPVILGQVVKIDNINAGVNYGLNKVRFPAPVPVGSRVRGHVSLVSAKPRGESIEAVFGLTVEIEGTERPACVAEAVVLYS